MKLAQYLLLSYIKADTIKAGSNTTLTISRFAMFFEIPLRVLENKINTFCIISIHHIIPRYAFFAKIGSTKFALK